MSYPEEIKEEQEKTQVSYEILNVTQEDMRVIPQKEVRIDLSQVEEDYLITDGGDYLLEGEYDYTLYVDAEDKIVHLFLDNVNINSNTGAAICIKSAGKVIITLLENSSNLLVDAPIREGNIEEKAAIISNTDITINGFGSLSVLGYYGDGIRTKDILKVLDSEIYVQTKGDGLRGSDGILLQNSNLKVESEKVGLLTNNIGKNGKGTLAINGGELSVVSGDYAILVQQDLSISDCELKIKGVKGKFYVGGNEYIDEECLIYE